MTEKSTFWDGTARGDGELSPYSSLRFNAMTGVLMGNEGQYVLPDQLNNLEVTAGAGRTVSVNSGHAFISGLWYENSAAVTLTHTENTSDYGRWDRVVVEWDQEDDSCELVILEGTPEALPSPPELNTCSTLKQCPLARVYLPASYASTQTYYVFDERKFANNVDHINNYSTENHFPNGSFMAYYAFDSLLVHATIPPWLDWPDDTYSKDRFPSMKFGRVLRVGPAASGNGPSIILPTNENATRRFTLRFLIKVEEGEAAVSWAGTSLRMPAAGFIQEVIIRPSTTGYQQLDLTHQTDYSVFNVGDFRLGHGFIVPPQEVNYPQFLKTARIPIQALTDQSSSSWTGSYLLAEDSRGLDETPAILPGTKAVLVELAARDSGSAGGSGVYAEIFSVATSGSAGAYYGGEGVRTDLDGVTNDTWRYAVGLVKYDEGTALNIVLQASGAGTMDATIYVIGMII